MTGNDIVDIELAAAESNWKRKGFIEKIFTSAEQQYITDAITPDKMVWKLWSMKESAYKIYTRQFGGYFFAPQKFSCIMLNETSGMVIISTQLYYTITITNEKYIYSIASTDKSTGEMLLHGCFILPVMDLLKQQQYIYEKIINRYALLTAKEKKKILVWKNESGVPFLYEQGNKSKTPVSITHHGSYAAFCI